jgi:hypothetical protein
MASRFSFFNTAAEAAAAAPAGRPYTVVDRFIKARRPRPSIDDVIKQTRRMMPTPYPQHDWGG